MNNLEIDKIRVNCEIKEPNMDILYYLRILVHNPGYHWSPEKPLLRHLLADMTKKSKSRPKKAQVMYRVAQKSGHPYCFSGVRFFGPPCTINAELRLSAANWRSIFHIPLRRK